MSASFSKRAKLRASIAAKAPRAGGRRASARPGIVVSVKLSDDPKAYYREYARKYYHEVRKFHVDYMEHNRRVTRHNIAKSCPYPEMTAGQARFERMSVVPAGWLSNDWYYTDRRDRAQDEALQALLRGRQ